MHPLFICTDLDRTLLPNGQQPESAHARKLFSALVTVPEVRLAYVSGRHLEIVEDAILSYGLPTPDWIIADVGTSIYNHSSKGWYMDKLWYETLRCRWNGLVADALKPFLSDISALRLQENAKQNTFKLSYYIPLDYEQKALLKLVRECLAAANIKASLIYSIDEESDCGLLDLLPENATKLDAIYFLLAKHGIKQSNTLFSGDSGNDLQVLASPIASVLVANASPDVAEDALSLAQRCGHLDAFYRAKGGFLGMNGNYSAGILEGIAHFHPDYAAWMMSLG